MRCDLVARRVPLSWQAISLTNGHTAAIRSARRRTGTEYTRPTARYTKTMRPKRSLHGLRLPTSTHTSYRRSSRLTSRRSTRLRSDTTMHGAQRMRFVFLTFRKRPRALYFGTRLTAHDAQIDEEARPQPGETFTIADARETLQLSGATWVLRQCVPCVLP